MAFQYLDEESVFDAINDSKKYMRPLFEPFTEFERIARNRPYPGIDKSYPKVTDGTTAGVIQKTPRRILQQLPTGLAKSPGLDWLTPVAGFILNHQILLNANSQYTFLQKCWNGVSKALTYGSQPAYVPFINRGTYFGTDMTLPYIRDVFLEKGKISDLDSNYILMRAWYQPNDIKALIYREKNLKGKAEERKEEYNSGWDLQALSDIEDFISQKDDYSVTPAERDKNNRSGGVEIMHCFQRGIGGSFFSVHVPTNKVVRTRINKDPRGEIPVHYLYADTDGSNPLGRGLVELVGAMQNLMDSEVQMYQYNRALMLNPPMIKKGEWNDNQAKFAPNVLIDLGSNPNAAYEPVKIDSSAIQSFPSNYGLMKSQLMNLLSSPNPDVSAQSGNPGMSKTTAGVKTAVDVVNVDDNYIRKQTEAWLERIFETQLNLYFAEKHGIEELQLDAETADLIRDLPNGDNLVSPENQIRIDWDEEVKDLQFFIDPGSSEVKDNQEEIAELKEIIADVAGNPYSLQYIQQAGKTMNLGEVYKQLYEKLNLKNIDKILTDMPKNPDGTPQAPPPMAMDRPKLDVAYQDLPPAAQIQFLRNAGITVTEQDLMQGILMDPNVRGRVGGESAANSLDNHPLVKVMETLQIKFTDLPEDSKQELLRAIGIPSNQVSPTQQNLNLKSLNQQHDVLQGMTDQNNQQTQMQQQAAQNQTENQLAAQSQQQAAQQNQAQNQIQVQGQQQAQQTQSQANEGDNGNTDEASQDIGADGEMVNPEAGNVGQFDVARAQAAQQQAQPQQPTGQPSDNLTPEDHKYLAQLQKLGVPPQMTGQALAMLHHGYSAKEVLKMIQAVPSHG